MRKRTKHPDKNIEKAIIYAEKHGWKFKDSGNSAHAWGRLFCPLHTREGHQISIWSTPRSSHNHAEQICRSVEKCKHLVKEK